MGVLSITEVATDQTADFAYSGNRYTRVFKIFLDTDYCGPFQAANASWSLPQFGDPYPFDYYARVIACSVRKIEDDKHHVYEVTIIYDTEAFTSMPWNEPPIMSWSFKSYQDIVTSDIITGQPITSSAGEPCVPAVEQDRYNLVLTLTRNQGAFNPDAAGYYIGKVNTDYCWVGNLYIAPGYALVKNISGNYVYKAPYFYWEVTYEIELQTTTFIRQVLDCGTYYLDGGEKTSFMDGDELADKPQLLDGYGGALTPGYNAVYLPYYTYAPAYLADLELQYLVF